MKVYIVSCSGPESTSLLGVYASRESAMTAAEVHTKIVADLSCHWPPHREPVLKWERVADGFAASMFDVSVAAYEVQG